MKYLPLPVVVGIALVGTLGVVHGVYTDRWATSGQLEQALATLPSFPAKVGDWISEDLSFEPEDLARSGIKGCVYRRYRNPRTGEVVSVMVVCGRGGPISVHTPDICYSGAGFRQLAPESIKIIETDGRSDSFKVARFGKPGGLTAGQMEIYWTWSRDAATWEAPDNPRLALARSPALYKLYVVREFAPGGRAEATDSCESFLRRALPAIRQSISLAGS